MSLYDLAASTGRTLEPSVIIKHSAGASNDDPQNVTILSNSSASTSVVIAPTSPMMNNDPGAPTPPAVAVNIQTPEIKSALTKIARFIPTETVTIYLGAVSASASVRGSQGSSPFIKAILEPVTVYWLTALVLTPGIFLLILAIERTKAKKPVLSEFPYWKLSAAILGFLIWGLAVPGNTFGTSDIEKVVIAFAAILVSIILDLIDQFYEARKMNKAAGG